jgi:hypothetical protein
MTEKNTLSILENIKKKMQKFDQEPKKIETVAGINDEFEYIPSSKAKNSDVKIEVNNAAAEQKFAADSASEIDKEFASSSVAKANPAAAAPSTPAPAKPAAPQNYGGVEDDLGLDDLSDLEDTHQPQAATPVVPKAPVAPAPKAPVIEDHDDLHELNLDDHHEEAKTEAKKEEHDEFDLNFDLDDDETPQAPVKAAEPAPQVVEVPKPAAPASQAPKQNIDDIDLDKLLAEEDASRKQGQENVAPVVPAKPAMSADDEAFLKELEASDPIKSQTPAPSAPIPPAPVAPAPVKPPVPPVEAKKSISEELARDVDLDDLDDIEEQMFADSTPKAVAPVVPAAQNPQQQQIKEEVVAVKEDHRPVVPLDLSSVSNSYVSPDKDLEAMLENRHFSEVAMHLLESKLDNWLNEHLHGVVEKIVQEEVKKLFDKR